MPEFTRAVLKAAVVAAVGVLIIGLIAQALDVSMRASTPGSAEEEVPLFFAVSQGFVVTIIGAFAGRALLMRNAEPARMYRIVVWLVFVVLSVFAVIGGADTGTVITLLAMHVAVVVPTLVWVVDALATLLGHGNPQT